MDGSSPGRLGRGGGSGRRGVRDRSCASPRGLDRGHAHRIQFFELVVDHDTLDAGNDRPQWELIRLRLRHASLPGDGDERLERLFQHGRLPSWSPLPPGGVRLTGLLAPG